MEICIFCKIINKEIPAKIVFENDKVFAFEDVNPQAPTHILVIPKNHISDVTEVQDYAVLGELFEAINKIVKDKKLTENGFRVVLNTGKDAGMAVHHLHFHLLSGRTLAWPPG